MFKYFTTDGDGMKKIIILGVVTVLLFLVACGPSKQEICVEQCLDSIGIPEGALIPTEEFQRQRFELDCGIKCNGGLLNTGGKEE